MIVDPRERFLLSGIIFNGQQNPKAFWKRYAEDGVENTVNISHFDIDFEIIKRDRRHCFLIFATARKIRYHKEITIYSEGFGLYVLRFVELFSTTQRLRLLK